MFNFFAEENCRQGNIYSISGKDYNHIKNVLRMGIGDTFLISENKTSHLCSIKCFENETVIAEIIQENYQNTELPIKIYLLQGLPKSDKLELIIQKAVELGVYGIIPVEMEHSVVKIDAKKKDAKIKRWQAISQTAAKQSKRSMVPQVFDVMNYNQALEWTKELDLLIVPYENETGMAAVKETLYKIKSNMSVGIIIGPEGGFSPKEIESAISVGGQPISLGKRILRTETAAITAVSLCMMYSEINLPPLSE